MNSRFAKPLFLGGLILLMLAAVVAVALPFFVSSDLVRNAVQRELADFTGRTVEVRGDIDFTLYPTPVATLRNIVIPNEDDNAVPLLQVETAVANISALSLLSRSPEFTGFRLERPKLTLTQDTDGTIDWRNGFSRIANAANVARREIAKRAETGETELPTPTDVLDKSYPRKLGEISITGGSISVNNTAGEADLSITALNGTLNWPALDQSLVANGNGIVRGNQVEFTLSARSPLMMMAGQSSAIEATANSDIGAINFSGILGNFDQLFADGNLSISIQSMSAFMDFIDARIRAGLAFNQIEASGPTLIKGGKAVFSDLQLSIDGNAGVGVLEFSHVPDMPPLLAGTLDFETLDLRAFLGAFLELPGDSTAQDERVDLSITSQLRTDLRLSATEAKLDAITLSNVAATTQINDGAVIFDLGDAEAYGGNVQARVQFLKQPDLSFSAQTNFSGQNLDLAVARSALTLPSILPTGSATFSLDAEAPFGSWSDMINNARGVTSLKVTEGVTRGFGIERMLNESTEERFFTLMDGETSGQDFQQIDLAGRLADGVIDIEKAQIDYENGAISFEGVAPLRSGGIALTAMAVPAQITDETPVRNFFIGGSWSRAFATPLLPPPTALQ